MRLCACAPRRSLMAFGPWELVAQIATAHLLFTVVLRPLERAPDAPAARERPQWETALAVVDTCPAE